MHTCDVIHRHTIVIILLPQCTIDRVLCFCFVNWALALTGLYISSAAWKWWLLSSSQLIASRWALLILKLWLHLSSTFVNFFRRYCSLKCRATYMHNTHAYVHICKHTQIYMHTYISFAYIFSLPSLPSSFYLCYVLLNHPAKLSTNQLIISNCFHKFFSIQVIF